MLFSSAGVHQRARGSLNDPSIRCGRSAQDRRTHELGRVNLFYAFSPELIAAGELGWWRTKNIGLEDGRPFRFEMSLIYKWLGH